MQLEDLGKDELIGMIAKKDEFLREERHINALLLTQVEQLRKEAEIPAQTGIDKAFEDAILHGQGMVQITHIPYADTVAIPLVDFKDEPSVHKREESERQEKLLRSAMVVCNYLVKREADAARKIAMTLLPELESFLMRTGPIKFTPPAPLQPVQQPAPVGAVHQFRRAGASDWYDGHPDNDDGGGPYEVRILYAAPVAAPVAMPAASVQPDWLLASATELARCVWRDNYKLEVPNWEPLPDLAGVLSQIDNMVCGMRRSAVDTFSQPNSGRDAALEMKKAIIAVISYGHSHSEAPTAKFAKELLGAIERDDRVAKALAAHPANVAQISVPVETATDPALVDARIVTFGTIRETEDGTIVFSNFHVETSAHVLHYRQPIKPTTKDADLLVSLVIERLGGVRHIPGTVQVKKSDIIEFAAGMTGHASTTDGLDDDETIAWVAEQYDDWFPANVAPAKTDKG